MNHLPDDLRAAPALSRRFFLEADEGEAWACILKENGEIKIACNAEHQPHVFQRDFATDLLRALNVQIANGGAWSVGWCDGYTKLLILWQDEDGDMQFTVEDDEPVNHIIEAGHDHFVSQCFDAWTMWRRSQAILDLQPGETYKRTQGERRPSQR